MKWNTIVWRAGPALLIIGLISYFAGGGWGTLPSALVAWGTLVLAYVTFLSVQTSIQQGEKLRVENERLRREDRERELKRHAIEFIYKWARHVAEFTWAWYPFDNEEQLLNLWMSASILRVDALEVQRYSSLFDAELGEAVNKSVEDFANFSLTFLTRENDESGKELIKERQSTANKSAQDLVLFVTDLKISLGL